jgi:hypothetical protein
LKIGGYARADFGYNTLDHSNRAVSGSTSAASHDQTSFQSKIQLGFDARTDTDYGLLRSFVLFDIFTGNNGRQLWQNGSAFSGTSIYMDKAYIQFGGLTAGYAESFFSFYDNYFGDTYFAPYAGSGIFTQQLLAYTAQFGGGFSATASIEDPVSGRGGFGGPGAPGFGPDKLSNGGTKMPNLIANFAYSGDLGKFQAMAALHQASALLDDNGSETKYGYAFGAGFSLNVPGTNNGYIAMEGDYAKGASVFTGVANMQDGIAGAPNAYDADMVAGGGFKLTTAWALTGEAGINLTPSLKAMAFGSFGRYNAASGALFDGDYTTYVAGGQLEYTVVKDLQIGGEVSYQGTKAKGDAQVELADGTLLDKQKTGGWIFGMRIRRTF